MNTPADVVPLVSRLAEIAIETVDEGWERIVLSARWQPKGETASAAPLFEEAVITIEADGTCNLSLTYPDDMSGEPGTLQP